MELVGPAGVGKSTLAARLGERAGVLRASVWNLPTLLVLESAAASFATLLAFWRVAGAPPWEAMKQVIRLEGLRRLLGRAAARRARLVVLDEGPVYALSWLRVCGDERLQNGRLRGWWQRTVAQWTDALGAVIFLDAPDPVLLERIRGRTKRDDRINAMADPEIRAHAASYRATFEGVIAALTGGDRSRVLSFAADEDADRVIERLLAALERDHHVD